VDALAAVVETIAELQDHALVGIDAGRGELLDERAAPAGEHVAGT
jgi:hypothetical protein